MHSKRLVQLSLCACAAYAFQDTSPFFLFSTSSLPTVDSIPAQQVAQSSQVSSVLLGALEECPSGSYILVSQLGASAEDFRGEHSTPHLRRRISKKEEPTGSRYVVPEVLGKMDVSAIEKQLMDKCGVTGIQVDGDSGSIDLNERYPQLIKVNFASLKASSDERKTQLAKNDFFLNTILNNVSPQYTFIYTTTPPTEQVVTNQQKESAGLFDWNVEDTRGSVHADLKRDVDGQVSKRQNGENNSTNDRALFEKYNFLNPGMFMGLTVSILLISILYVGMTAIGNVQVSYAAFSKEMGPKAQNKQQ